MMIFVNLLILGLISTVIERVLSKVRICFQDHDVNARGTTLAIYDYADFAETLLGYESIILIPTFRLQSSSAGLERYQRRFPVVTYGESEIGGQKMIAKVKEINCNVLFIAKSGDHGSLPSYPESYPCDVGIATHCIFTYAKQGTTCAALNQGMFRPEHLRVPNILKNVLPFIVRPPQVMNHIGSYRTDLKVPSSALVLCRHGGKDTFDISFVHETIRKLIDQFPSSKLQFIFLNTDNFLENVHPQVHFIPPNVTREGKEKFFKSCDGMIHGRRFGETFGLAVAEFSVRNKPVITQDTSKNHPSERFHTDVLGSSAFIYHDQQSLYDIISSLVKNGIPAKKYDGFAQFLPEKVMKIFDDVMIRPILENNLTNYHNKNRCGGANVNQRKSRSKVPRKHDIDIQLAT